VERINAAVKAKTDEPIQGIINEVIGGNAKVGTEEGTMADKVAKMEKQEKKFDTTEGAIREEAVKKANGLREAFNEYAEKNKSKEFEMKRGNHTLAEVEVVKLKEGDWQMRSSATLARAGTARLLTAIMPAKKKRPKRARSVLPIM